MWRVSELLNLLAALQRTGSKAPQNFQYYPIRMRKATVGAWKAVTSA